MARLSLHTHTHTHRTPHPAPHLHHELQQHPQPVAVAPADDGEQRIEERLPLRVRVPVDLANEPEPGAIGDAVRQEPGGDRDDGGDHRRRQRMRRLGHCKPD